MKARAVITIGVALGIACVAPGAHAVDGCLVLLCLAGNWSAIGECVPPVEQVFADLALGQPFPTCAFASAPVLPASAQATQSVASMTAATTVNGPTFATLEGLSQANCPVQYAQELFGTFSCSGFVGSINVTVNGVPWSQTLWSPDGGGVTCYSAAAETALAISNTPCDQALAAYNARVAATAAATISSW
ncbi:MAG TPA: hypothetical protein VEE84_03620 [Burkholderiaceae bacterium]|nr:hypothetical protein [Burkholderiaceae bacterium]